MYVIRDLYIEYVEKSYNSLIEKTTQFFKWTKDLNKAFLHRRYACQLASENILNSISFWVNANQNHNRISFHTHQDGNIQKKTIKSVDEDLKKLEALYSACGNPKWCIYFGKQFGKSSNH